VDEVSFNGLALWRADGRVMTPRPASEQLVAEASRRLRGGRRRVADVGTGSGAIAIAIANACPEAEVWATDNDSEAVALARSNVERHGLGGRVFVRLGDLLEPVPESLDVIVANLPYLPEDTAAEHPDLWREPARAVFAPGDGLDPYRRLIDAAERWLAADGALLLQLDGRALVATRAELRTLRARMNASRLHGALTANAA
jgi:release factor glutamine methyltransferase